MLLKYPVEILDEGFATTFNPGVQICLSVGGSGPYLIHAYVFICLICLIFLISFVEIAQAVHEVLW